MFSRRLQVFIHTAFSRKPRTSPPRRRSFAFRPAVEALEQRAVPSAVANTTITASTHEINYGDSITFTAIVRGENGPPTGVVQFFSLTGEFGNFEQWVPLTTVDGVAQATITTKNLPLGNRTVRAWYWGDSVYAPTQGLGPSTNVLVSPASTTTSLQVISPSPTDIYRERPAFSATDAPVYATAGSDVLLVARVTSPGIDHDLLAHVKFLDGTTVLGEGSSIFFGTYPPMLKTNQLSLGTHTITAVYDWMNKTGPASSTATATVIVTPQPVATLNASTNYAPVGEPVTFTATFTAPDGIATGSALFMDGETVLAEVPLNAVGDVAEAQFTASGLGLGNHVVSALYKGSYSFYAAAAPAADTHVSVVSTAMLSASPDNVVAYQRITFTAVFNGFEGSLAGSVWFMHNGGVLGEAPLTFVDGVAQATFTSNGFSAGNQTISAVYHGPTRFFPFAPQPTFGVTVNQPVWSIPAQATVSVMGADVGSPSQVYVIASSTDSLRVGPTTQFIDNVPVSTGQANYVPATEQVTFRFVPFDPGFTGGVRTAVGDVNNDGTPDIVAAAGPGGGPNVIVFNGRNGLPLYNFFAFDPGFTGGVTVAVGDVNNDGFADIICGADTGGGPNVSVFSGRDGSRLSSFFAYDPLFTGGVNVAAGNVLGTGATDVIVGAGPGGGPHVTVFNGATGTLLASFFAYDAKVTTGVIVAAADEGGGAQQPLIVQAESHSTTFLFDRTVIVNFFAQGLPGSSPAARAGLILDAANGDSEGDSESASNPNTASAAELDAYFAADPVRIGSLFVAN